MNNSNDLCALGTECTQAHQPVLHRQEAKRRTSLSHQMSLWLSWKIYQLSFPLEHSLKYKRTLPWFNNHSLKPEQPTLEKDSLQNKNLWKRKLNQCSSVCKIPHANKYISSSKRLYVRLPFALLVDLTPRPSHLVRWLNCSPPATAAESVGTDSGGGHRQGHPHFFPGKSLKLLTPSRPLLQSLSRPGPAREQEYRLPSCPD